MSGLYIHIPFCASKCSYCDFYSMPLKNRSLEFDYVNALINEFHLRESELNNKIDTIYIGGGTPSQLSINAITELIGRLKDDCGIDISSLSEFTIEANPEDVSQLWADTISTSGVNRVSIGIQSFNDAELRAVGRRHDAQQAVNAISRLRDAGITEISGDLIYGLPGQTTKSWEKSVSQILELRLPHISTYSLSYEPGTRLSAMLQTGKVNPVSDDEFALMYKYLIDNLRNNAYEHYEISNFSLPGHRAIHNSGYWNFSPYLGLGPGAHSFDGKKRRYNPSNLKKYIRSLIEMNPIFEEEVETDCDLINDYIITALRKSEGIDLKDMSAVVGKTSVDSLKRTAAPFISNGTIVCDDDRLRFTEESWLISDMALRELIQ